MDHVAITIFKISGHKCGRLSRQEGGYIAAKICHAALEQLCTLSGRFSGADGGRRASIPGTYRPSKMGRRYRTPGHDVGDVSIIELPRDAPIRAPQTSIPYLWIFEGASEEEVGF